MIDVNQFLLIIVALSLTTIFVLIGVWLILLLTETRRTVQKVNKILDEALIITQHIEKPMGSISSLISSVTTALSFIKIFRNKKEEDNV